METVPNTTLEVMRYMILKIHYNQPKIVGTRMKFTQKVDNFTVFESFSSTSCCSQKFPPKKIEKLACWTCKVVSGMFTMGGWWGNRMVGKVYSTKWWFSRCKALKLSWKACAGSLMDKMYTDY